MANNESSFLKAMKNIPDTETENGGRAYSSSGAACLDLFSQVGALRNAMRTPETLFADALAEDPTLALKIMFFARDIRGGLGEREVFRQMLKYLAQHHPEYVVKNIGFVAEFGRYDDLLVLLDENNGECCKLVVEYIRKQLAEDRANLQEGKEISLLGKWLPSINASSQETRKLAQLLCQELGIKLSCYRKELSQLRKKLKIVENNLRTRDYSFPYENVPGKALFKYRRAFWRNDKERYLDFLERAKQNPKLMHAATVAPYEIVEKILNALKCLRDLYEEELTSLDTTWKALPDYTTPENALVVMDGSGSMMCGGKPMPLSVAQSLAIYFAERNRGMFRNHFITFSENPKLVEIKGDTIGDMVRYCSQYDECSNTDLAKTFDVILETAVENNLAQEEMPDKLYIITDMEFDYCVDGGRSVTTYTYAKSKFEAAGYRLPQIVFWNVCARGSHLPVRKDENGVALVSGFTSQLFTSIAGHLDDPYNMMLQVLNQERYKGISA